MKTVFIRRPGRVFASLAVHPSFYILGLFLTLTGRGLLFTLSVFSALVHEAAHALAAKASGYPPPDVRLLPYGASAAFDGDFQKKDAFVIHAAGVLASLAAAVLSGALASFLSGSAFLNAVFWINLELFAFNVVPLYPLDGAKIAIALSKNKFRTLRTLRRAGVAASYALTAASVVSLFFTFNPTFGIAGIFLYMGANDGIDQEEYKGIYEVAMRVGEPAGRRRV